MRCYRTVGNQARCSAIRPARKKNKKKKANLIRPRSCELSIVPHFEKAEGECAECTVCASYLGLVWDWVQGGVWWAVGSERCSCDSEHVRSVVSRGPIGG